jgi:GT2 family glycosyltransferase
VSASIIVPTFNGAPRLRRLLETLAAQTADHQVVVVDNASTDETSALLAQRFPAVDVLRLERNEGFSRAVNAGARSADGEVLVLLNNDCVCDPDFVEEITAALRASDAPMAAGVMRDRHDASLIDSAGMQLDGTLLVSDYLNGERVSALDGVVPDPVGPSAAAAAFDRSAFLDVGGFDEAIFAYWEDVDLVLRLRLLGGHCILASRARGVHEHSATLGSGSARKNYLMGFGRGYVLRKWSVLRPRRVAAVAAREVPICLGQAVVDRNLTGVVGRIRGYRAVGPDTVRPYPGGVLPREQSPSAASSLGLRMRRRLRLRQRRA